MRLCSLLAPASLVFLLTASLPAAILDPEVDEFFARTPELPVFVNIVLAASADELADVQARVLEELRGEFEVVYRYQHVPALSGEVTRRGWELLQKSGSVRAAGLDRKSEAQLDASVPFVEGDWAQLIGWTGSGITIAVIDSGIDTDHPDLMDDIAPGAWHFLDQGVDQGPGAEDVRGHGTAMSGIITSGGIVAPTGMAPDAKVLAVEVLDSNGSGWSSDIVAGIDYVVSVKGNYADLSIMNMSLGQGNYSSCPCDNENSDTLLFSVALNAARDAGILPIVAAGNSTICNGMNRPACLTAAVPVARINLTSPPNGFIASSRQSACNQLAAPGTSILTSELGGGAASGSGTSAAAPHVSGALALLRQRAHTLGVQLSPDQMQDLLLSSSIQSISSCTAHPAPRTLRVRQLINSLSNLGPDLIRGDVDGDGSLVAIPDAIFLLQYLFASVAGTSLGCPVAADVNDDSAVNISDVVMILHFGFTSGPAPQPPYPNCGPDPTVDALGCTASSCP